MIRKKTKGHAKNTHAKKAPKKAIGKKTSVHRAFMVIVPLSSRQESIDGGDFEHVASPYDMGFALTDTIRALNSGRFPEEPIKTEIGVEVGKVLHGYFAENEPRLGPGFFIARVNLAPGSIDTPEQVGAVLGQMTTQMMNYAIEHADKFTPGVIHDANHRSVGYWKVTPGEERSAHRADLKKIGQSEKSNGMTSRWNMTLALDSAGFRDPHERLHRPSVAEAVMRVARAIEETANFDGVPEDSAGTVVGAYGNRVFQEPVASKTLKASINLRNIAMQTPHDVARSLPAVARSIAAGYDNGDVFDSNGNVVGSWKLVGKNKSHPKANDAVRTKSSGRPVTPDSVRNYLRSQGFAEADVTTDESTNKIRVTGSGVTTYHPSQNVIGRPQEERVNHDKIAVVFMVKGEGAKPTDRQVATKKKQAAKILKSLQKKYAGVTLSKSGQRITLDATRLP